MTGLLVIPPKLTSLSLRALYRVIVCKNPMNLSLFITMRIEVETNSRRATVVPNIEKMG